MWLKQFRERWEKKRSRWVVYCFRKWRLRPSTKIVFISKKGNLSGRSFVRPLLICATTDRSGGWCRCSTERLRIGHFKGRASRWASGQRVETFSNIFIWFPKTAIEGGASGTVLIAGPPTKRRLSQTDGFIDESPKNLNPPGSGFGRWPMTALVYVTCFCTICLCRKLGFQFLTKISF